MFTHQRAILIPAKKFLSPVLAFFYGEDKMIVRVSEYNNHRKKEMGYCITQTDTRFFIPQEFHGLALAAIKELMLEKYTADGGVEVILSYTWVNTDEVVQSETLSDALYAWRWEAETNPNGDIDAIYFGGEKQGSDECLFRVISPFVKEGSYISMRGEDGEMWRWYFDGQKCIEQYGTVVWK